MSKPFRIGIIGGMGPAADIRLQQLIRETTPATKDQDHLQILCCSNPSIPDRTESLVRDGGEEMATALVQSARVLESAGATVIVMACHTAHARLADVERAVSAPVVNLIAVSADAVADVRPHVRKAGLIATNGTLRAGLYRNALRPKGIVCVEPEPMEQARLNRVITALKAGVSCAAVRDEVLRIGSHLGARGADCIILACTELSLCTKVTSELPYVVIDPLRVVAERLVCMSSAHTQFVTRRREAHLPPLRDFLRVVVCQQSLS